MKKRIWIPVLVILFMAAGCVWYINDYYKSDESVLQYLQDSDAVKAIEIRDGLHLDGPGEEDALIFYPGAKVEYTAYAPLFHKLAGRGMDVFLVKMPCNLAFLGKDKAGDIMSTYDYCHWFLAGHSLGGAMAASYAAGHLKELNGLVLLAAYPTKELKEEGFSVLSLYGSEDGVLNMEKVGAGRSYMPEDYTEICIEGGNHAWFGNYGEQKGDNQAVISREEQQEQTVGAICRLMNSCGKADDSMILR